MRVTQTICGAGAVCFLAVCSLYSQLPAKPKPQKPAATSARSSARTADYLAAGSLPQLVDITASTGILSLARMLSGANAFEISDIQEDENRGCANQATRM